MTRPSSIFSSSTLRASFRPGGTLVLAGALVAALELGVRLGAPRIQWSDGAPSFDLLVDRYRHTLATNRFDLWVFGNSTLHKAIDMDRLRTLTGRSIQSLPVGSGTLAGQVAMLDYFLRRAPAPPEQVVLCLTKDDLNSAGYRAKHSRRYLDYDTWRGLTVERFFRLDDVRTAGLDEWKSMIRPTPPPAGDEKDAPDRRYDGRLSRTARHHLKSLFKDFTFDASAFPRLEALSETYRFRTAVFLMPVTDVYLDYHDRRYVAPLTSADIATRIGQLCERHGFEFHDYSRAALDRHPFFEDTHHMNANGRAWFTPVIARDLGPQAGTPGLPEAAAPE